MPNITHNRVITLLSGSAPLYTQSMARFLKFIYKDINHSHSTINYKTKNACMNPTSVCGRNCL